ncbi:MAG: PAS domain S-box protein, partial [Acidobacteriota bacterium]
MKRTGKAKPGQVAESTPGEETYRAVFENTGTATAIVEEDTLFTHVNKEMERLSGCTRQELEGKKKWTDFVAGEDLPAMRAHLLKRLQAPGNASHHYEFRLIDRSGKAHDVYMTYALIPGTKQRIASLLDITKHRRMEAALQASQEELALLLESSLDAIFLTAPDGEIFYANRAACKMLGRTKEEICSLGRNGIIDTSDPRLSAALEERARTGRFGGELTYVRKDGSKFPGEVSSVIYRDKEGRQRTSMIVRDLTERKRTKEALRAREEWYHTIFENTGTAMVTLEEGTVISHANKEFERLSGYTRQEIEGKKRWTDFVVPEDLEFMRVRHQLRRESQGSVPHQYEFRFVDRSGKVHDIFLSVDLLPGTKQSAASLLDMTERKRAEEALRASEALLSTVFNMSPIAIAITRLSDGRIINVNEAWEKVTGYSKQEALAHDAPESGSLFLHGERSKSIRRMAEQGPTRKAEVTIVTKSGGLVHFLMSSVPIQVA